MSKTKKILIGIILLTVVLLGVGYAAIQNVTLNIAGTATADPSQSNFIVRFTGTPEVSDSDKVTAEITDDTNATINVEGLTASGEIVTATYTVENASTDLSADLTVETTNSNEEYFVIDAELAKTSIVAGEATTLTVTVELIKTPISDTETSTIGIQMTATPVQPGQEGTTNGGSGGTSSAPTLNEYGFYFGVPYSITQDDTKYSYVFFENGAAYYYENEIKLGSAPEGTIIYGEKTITEGENTYQVSVDGTEIIDGSYSVVAELGVTVAKCGVWGHSNDDGLNHILAEGCFNGHYECENACIGECTVACGEIGHYEGDGLNHTIATNCPAGHYVCQDACGSWQVPTGATYTMVSAVAGTKTVYNEGELLPECYQAQTGDIFISGDYEYRYGQEYNGYYNEWKTLDYGAWNVRVVDDTKTEYGEIYEKINGETITRLIYTFDECKSMINAPEIPKGITRLDGAFCGCSSLTTPPELPSEVTTITALFQDCTSLTTAPQIPDNVTSMYSTFYNCNNLKTYVGSIGSDGDFGGYVLPEKLTDLQQTFWHCTYITCAPAIPASVRTMTSTFVGCANLKTYAGSEDEDGDFSGYKLPDGLTWMFQTFSGCTSLTVAPTIPPNVTTLYQAFANCTSLRSVSAIPPNVTDMVRTFYNCTSLTGSIQINTDKITNNNSANNIDNNGYGCFMGTEKSIVLKGTGNNQAVLELLVSTANNGNITVE